MHIIPIKTTAREQLLDITPKIISLVRNQGVKSGICIVSCLHTTTGLTINENADPDVKSDIIKALEIYDRDDFQHAEGNSPAHVKSSLMGHSLNLIIENGSLQLGTWQAILFCEFDGPRNRKIIVEILPK